MKRITSFLLVFLLIIEAQPVFAGSVNVKSDAVYSSVVMADKASDFRAVWVSTVLNLDFPSKKGISSADMQKEIIGILDRSVDIGLNTIVLQVRPTADALYKSSIFPWSEFLTGTAGKAPDSGFDPLAFWVEEAHRRGLALHAWLNPYRVTHSAAKKTDIKLLPESSPARKNPSWVITYKNALYFDPGLPETRKLIIDGALEIVKNYDVDGIHLDDYFYPDSEFPDSAAYKKYSGGKALDDWRRENVNLLVSGLYKAIKAEDSSVEFGISPFAIWQNKSSTPTGSAYIGTETRGLESYKTYYSDSVKWVQEGWLDYICPQIYWNIGYEIADYKIVLNWWEKLCKDSKVDLYVGMAAYREFEGQKNWNGELVRQLNLNEAGGVVKGVSYFRYGSIKTDIGDKIKNYYAGKTANTSGISSLTNPLLPATALNVSRPADDVKTTGENYYLLGTSDPAKPLYMNGVLVEGRTEEGFFGVYCPLVLGVNTFTFTQEGQKNIVRKVTRNNPSTSPGGGSGAKTTFVKTDAKTPYYATVTAESAWLYSSYSQNGGSSWQLLKGQKDLVVETTSDKAWIKLACGMWIEKENVSLTTEKSFLKNTITKASFTKGVNIDLISFTTAEYQAIACSYDGTALTVNFGMKTTLPSIDVSQSTVFESCTVSGSVYTFKLKQGQTIEGYYQEYKDGAIRLNIRRKRSLAEGDKPLAGFKFVIDAGHGGTDTGAYGPLGSVVSEKVLNLIYATKLSEKLRAKGATVVLVRDSDVFYTLQQRTDVSRKVNPDLFISIHGNSVDATANAGRASGLTVWYRNSQSAPFAQTLIDRLYTINPNTNRYKQINQSNFFVCRPSHAPSVIIETSFLPNVRDFSWLIKSGNQDLLAEEITQAVIDYYK